MLVALTIAGSDSSGGAGLQADLKAFASQGVHGAVAITAVTAQNTQRVAGIHPLPSREVVAQIDAVLEDVPVSGAKTGMLYSASIARAVARRLDGEPFPLVVDPVMVAGVGDALSGADLVGAIRDRVAPLATVLTPNLPEAESLLGHNIEGEEGARAACRELLELGCEAVLLKGGHAAGPTCRDLLYHRGKFLVLEYPRVAIRGHGGGCVLAALLAANLAKGMTVPEATLKAKASVHQAVLDNYIIGGGVPVVSPLTAVYRGAQAHEVSGRLLRSARDLARLLPRHWVPEVGADLAFALPGARTREEVWGLEAPIVGCGNGAVLPAGVAAGGSEHLSAVVLAAMARHGGMRSAASLRMSEDNLARAREAGMTTAPGRKEGGASPIKPDSRTDSAISIPEQVPDVIYELAGPRGVPLLCLLGRGPEEVLAKARRLVA